MRAFLNFFVYYTGLARIAQEPVPRRYRSRKKIFSFLALPYRFWIIFCPGSRKPDRQILHSEIQINNTFTDSRRLRGQGFRAVFQRG